jgi:thiamine kinase-like enzyme
VQQFDHLVAVAHSVDWESAALGLGEIDLAMLLERKRKILEKYETNSVQNTARKKLQKAASKIDPPLKLRERLKRALRDEAK